MKILHICELYDVDAEFQENQIVKYSVKRGHQVRVLTSTYTNVFDYYANRLDRDAKASHVAHHGADIFRLPYKYNILHKIRAYRGVRSHLEEFQPDLIYIHDVSPNIPEIVGYKRKNPKCRMVMDIHMDYSNSGKGFMALKILHGTLRRYFMSKARPHLSKIFSIVPAGFPFLQEIYGVAESEIELLPLGADIDLIDEVRQVTDRTSERAQLGFSPDDLIIITGGKLTPRKRQELLLSALDTPELAHVKLIIVGQVPPGNDEYEKLINALSSKLGKRVAFVGWQKPRDVYRYMALADIAVFPASQSIMWQQAIGSGLPLVVGNAGGQDPSYLNRHDNIVILQPDDISVAGYRDAIKDLSDNPDKRQAMANGADRTGREFLDWNLLLDRTLRFNAVNSV